MSSTFWPRIKGFSRRRASLWLGRRVWWLEPESPIISFTFDDFPRTALLAGGKILKSQGATGTFYTSLGLMDQDSPSGRVFSLEDLRNTVAAGHELGCHTYEHCHAWDTAPRAFEKSIEENRQALAKIMPEANFPTHSYPIDVPRPSTKRRAGRRFSCCRGGGQTYNLGPVDANCLKSFFLEQSRDNPDAVKKMINLNREMSGWLIFSTHDVCDDPSRFGCKPGFLEMVVRYAVASGARIMPVGKAWEHLTAKYNS